LFKNATLAQLVLTIFLQKSTFLLFLFCLRQAAMILSPRPRSYGTGSHFDSHWNLFWDRFERPGRVSISCALYKSFAYVGFPLLLKEGACFFSGFRKGSLRADAKNGSWIMAIKISE